MLRPIALLPAVCLVFAGATEAFADQDVTYDLGYTSTTSLFGTIPTPTSQFTYDETTGMFLSFTVDVGSNVYDFTSVANSAPASVQTSNACSGSSAFELLSNATTCGVELSLESIPVNFNQFPYTYFDQLSFAVPDEPSVGAFDFMRVTETPGLLPGGSLNIGAVNSTLATGSTPEPSTLGLLGTGVLVAAGFARRRGLRALQR